MRQVDLNDYKNPRGYRVVHCLEAPRLYEIRDRWNKRLKNDKYSNRLRAEEILATELEKKESDKD